MSPETLKRSRGDKDALCAIRETHHPCTAMHRWKRRSANSRIAILNQKARGPEHPNLPERSTFVVGSLR